MSLRPGSVSASLSVNPDAARIALPPPLCFSERLLSRSLYFGPLHTSLFLSCISNVVVSPFWSIHASLCSSFYRMPPPVVVGREQTLSSNFGLFSPSFNDVFIYFCSFLTLFSLFTSDIGLGSSKKQKSVL